MSIYCTQADLLLAVRQEELVQLADDSENGDGALGDAEVDAVIARAIARASARVDAVAGAHYQVPFDPVPDFVRDLAVDLVLSELAERRSAPPKWAETRRGRAAKDLAALADGSLTVGVQPAPARNPERIGAATSEDRIFDATTLQGF